MSAYEWRIGDVADIHYRIDNLDLVWKVAFTGQNINVTIGEVASEIANLIQRQHPATDHGRPEYTVRYVLTADQLGPPLSALLPVRSLRARAAHLAFRIYFQDRPIDTPPNAQPR